MREYELTVVISPEVDEEARKEVIEWMGGQLTTAGATEETTNLDEWGNRGLAYPIKKLTSGYYLHYNVALDPEKTRDMERNMRYREDLLRFLLVRKEE